MNTVTFDTGNFTVIVIGLVIIVCAIIRFAFVMGMEHADYQHYLQGMPRGEKYFDSKTGRWMEAPPHE